MINYSIIIPHYNSSKSLVRLLNSIPDRDDIEIIVINENRCEPTFYETLYSKLFFLRKGNDMKGPGFSRNIGLDHAKGKWILFADDDDYYLKGAFNVLDSYLDTKTDIIYLGLTSVYDCTNEEGHRHYFHMKRLKTFISKNNKKSELFLQYRWPQVWSKMIRREFIEFNKIRFDNIMISEDSIFSYKAAYMAKNIKGDIRKIYCLTRSKGSITTMINEEFFDVRLIAALSVLKFLKGKIKNKYLPPATFKLLVYSRKYGIKKVFKVFNILIKTGVNPFLGLTESLIVFSHDLKYKYKDKKYKSKCDNL